MNNVISVFDVFLTIYIWLIKDQGFNWYLFCLYKVSKQLIHCVSQDFTRYFCEFYIVFFSVRPIYVSETTAAKRQSHWFKRYYTRTFAPCYYLNTLLQLKQLSISEYCANPIKTFKRLETFYVLIYHETTVWRYSL